MKALLLGNTGLLGQAMAKELRGRNIRVHEAARRGSASHLNVEDLPSLSALLAEASPDIVINCVALVDIDACERDPGRAWRVNGRPLAVLADWAATHDRPLLHVSTDQYFLRGGNHPHDEAAPVTLINEYARTKFAGEALALTAPQALVLRTAIVGIRKWPMRTFAEWAIDVAEKDQAVQLFADAFTSAIDVATFAKASLDLLDGGARGLFNLASREVYSKERFVHEIAAQMGRRLSNATTGSVSVLPTRRANCLGLNVRRAQQRLDYELPDLHQVIASILRQHEESNPK